MNTTVIVLIILLIVVAAGVAFWYTNQQAKAEEEAAAAAAAAAAAMTAAMAAAPTPEVAPAPAPEVAPTPADTHPLAGDKFIIVKGETTNGVARPNGTVDMGNARTEDHVFTFEPVEGEADTYLLFAKEGEKYLKYSENKFLGRKTKPTGEKTLQSYKIKFTKIGDDYVMSYMDDDKEMFFGFVKTNDDFTMTEDENPGVITNPINVVEAGVSSFIFTGNFGGEEDKYVPFSIALDDDENPKKTIEGCFETFPDVDLGEDVSREDILAISYNATADDGKRCRAYMNKPGVSANFDKTASAWVTVCADRTKDLNKGCLL
jgi:type II secretory pathway pseudopilin PulG